jgi:hypothetical protein
MTLHLTPAPAREPGSPRCPIARHDHALRLVKIHASVYGELASTWECPLGMYRWFQLGTKWGQPVSDAIRQRRPRFGWRVL